MRNRNAENAAVFYTTNHANGSWQQSQKGNPVRVEIDSIELERDPGPIVVFAQFCSLPHTISQKPNEYYNRPEAV